MAEEKETLQEEVNKSEQENIQPEEVFGEAADTQSEGDSSEVISEVSALEAKVAELEKKVEEADNRYLRLQADFDNSRRRAKLDREASEKYRAQSLVSDLLPALDNFERALQSNSDDSSVQSLLQGMEMVYRSLIEALKKEGVEQIEAVGQVFDPQFHQAVMQVEEEGYDSNVVVEEFQKGYLLKDRVIRPAMVKVNQ
ncbi:nucleotide exchange factor GrpE [Cytobacillus sp. FSL R5-0569]|uniref:nucleotide exchange factor GrpE n=1 Tax=Cytobacillus sp. FSL R5-0569 TaxID=2921649 RepID=UPI0030FCC5EC